jgi:hypothetical protein
MFIKETNNTPKIHFSIPDCKFEIQGNSYSDSLNELYEQVVDWIEKEVPGIDCPIEFKFQFYVFNSITYKNVLLIISKFIEFREKGKDIKVLWYYDKEDEDSYATGEDLQELFNIPIELIEF